VKNIDRWFILIGLLCGIFGFAFGIWMGVGEHFELAPVHAHINLVGFASMALFGLIYRSYPALAESKLAAAHFMIFTIGAVLFIAGLPLAQAHQTIAFAVIAANLTSARGRGRWQPSQSGRPRPGRAAASA
jgi:hypothetical protein